MSLTIRPIGTVTLQDLRWQARPVVILGHGAMADDQLARLRAGTAMLVARDVVILTDGPGAAPLRQGNGFSIVLIGKDGGIKLRRDRPVDVAELTNLIDTMPMRQREAGQDR